MQTRGVVAFWMLMLPITLSNYPTKKASFLSICFYCNKMPKASNKKKEMTLRNSDEQSGNFKATSSRKGVVILEQIMLWESEKSVLAGFSYHTPACTTAERAELQTLPGNRMDLWFGAHPYARQKDETAGGWCISPWVSGGERAPSSAVVSSHSSVRPHS